MKHLIETTNPSGLTRVDYDRIVLDSIANDVIVKGGGYEYEVIADSYIYNEVDNKYYQKLVAYGKPIETNAIVDLNSQWISDSEDNKYSYFKSDSYDVDLPFSQCKVTWSNLTSITFKYMVNSDKGVLFVLKLDSKKFTDQSGEGDIYLTTGDKTPGTYNEFTIECDESEHHIWFGYMKGEGATDEDRGFIGVPKYASPILDIKQGSELPIEYKSGGVSAENGKTYDINFKNVILPNGSNILPSYEDYTKTEKAITYEYVDLGLSSGLKWATCNVGASSETESGVSFQWGETSGISETLLGKYSDENYSWESYAHCNDGSSHKLTKYNNTTEYGENPDNKRTLDLVDDAARVHMGGDWRMPTRADFQELLSGTTNEWIANYNGSGKNGRKFTASNGNSIFIPAAGFYNDGSVCNAGKHGSVWSSQVDNSGPSFAYGLHFDSGECNVTSNYGGRCLGRFVRGVRK